MKYQKNPKTGRVWVDLTGEKIGRWTVLGLTGRMLTAAGLPQGMTVWKCQCECGKIKESVNYTALVGGKSQSCGCLRKEVLSLRAKKHGDSKAKAYRAWQQAQQRCFNDARPYWNNYGGRGITMCDAFKGNYPAWRDALGPAPTPKHSVDRRNNEGHYSCGLCQQCVENKWFFNIHWATPIEQGQNTRSAQKFMWEGCVRNLTEIARMEDVAFCSFRNRVIQNGMSIRNAIEYCRKKGLIYNERAKSILEANPNIKNKPPKFLRPRRKSVPISVDSCPE